jgi:hypothetical protein
MGIPDRYKMLAEAIDNYDAGQTADSEVIIDSLWLMLETFNDGYFETLYNFVNENIGGKK